MTRLEIAVQDQAGVEAALDAGADRIELCSALSLGGLTPTIGAVEAAVEAARARGVGGGIQVLIRSRPGGFVYDTTEVAVMARDVERVLEAGADGIVVGALTPGRWLDVAALRRWQAAAGDREVTFHRALDLIDKRAAALELLARAGIDRVLTSGGAPTCREGLAELRVLAGLDLPIQVMAGGGVAVADICDLMAAGADAIHLSARRDIADAPAGPGGGPQTRSVTDGAIVAAARAAIDARS